jgi:flagellar biosynthesis anti-sigma factor FlgM
LRKYTLADEMRIVDSTNLGNTTPVQTGRPGEVRSTDPAGRTGSAQRASSGTDTVQLSSFADRLSRTTEEAAANRAQHIVELTAAVRSGSYQVDARTISHAMVSGAISSDSTGAP